MKVIFRPAARRHLRDIGDWIARDNPDRAVTFVDELVVKAESLADMPFRFPVVEQSGKGPVRKLTHGKYLIFYRVLSTVVEVIGVRRGAQDKSRFD